MVQPVLSAKNITNETSLDVSDEHKKEIEAKIVEDIVFGLESNKISETDLPRIADFVLGKIDNIQNHEELVSFLNELSEKWPVFDNLEEVERGEVKDSEEGQAEKDVLK